MEFGYDPEWIVSDGQGKKKKRRPKREPELIGICMGADAATEHECGIADILDAFSGKKPNPYAKLNKAELYKKPPPFGVDARKVSVIPSSFDWFEKDGIQGFSFGCGTPHWYLDRARIRLEDPDKSLVCAWSWNAFLCMANKAEDVEKLQVIYKAIKKKDAVFKIAPGFLVARGLCILIASKLPKDVTQKWHDDDAERWNNEKAFWETGIEDELRAAGKKWFALSRYHEFDDGQWRVWLNPMEQHIHNFGWFTIPELKQWAQNTGPVMMKEPRR